MVTEKEFRKTLKQSIEQQKSKLDDIELEQGNTVENPKVLEVNRSLNTLVETGRFGSRTLQSAGVLSVTTIPTKLSEIIINRLDNETFSAEFKYFAEVENDGRLPLRNLSLTNIKLAIIGQDSSNIQVASGKGKQIGTLERGESIKVSFEINTEFTVEDIFNIFFADPLKGNIKANASALAYSQSLDVTSEISWNGFDLE